MKLREGFPIPTQRLFNQIIDYVWWYRTQRIRGGISSKVNKTQNKRTKACVSRKKGKNKFMQLKVKARV